MAEKPGELGNADNLDPIARVAGADTGPDPFIEKYGNEFPVSETERFEMSEDDGEQPKETDHIKAQIEETRSQMGETIDAIQERLSLANVSEQVSEQFNNVIESAKDSIYDATIGKAVYFMKHMGEDISGSRVVRTVQSNPLPILLIGIGAGLLAFQSFGKNKRPIRGLGRFEPVNRGTDKLSAGDSGDSLAGRAYDGVSGAAESAYSSVSNVAGSAYETVSGAVGGAYSGAGDVANRAYQTAGEFGSKAQQQYEYYIDENPLAVGAVAAALGAAVGLAFPSTKYESQLMGETRQQLMEKAQAAAGELVDRAKHVADEAGKTIKDEAKALTQ